LSFHPLIQFTRFTSILPLMLYNPQQNRKMLFSSQSHWVTTIIKSSIYIQTDTCQLVIHSTYFFIYINFLSIYTYIDLYTSDPSLSTHFRRCSLNYFFLFSFFFILLFFFYFLIIVTEQKQCAECQLFLINKLSVFSHSLTLSFSFIHESPASVSFRWLNRFKGKVWKDEKNKTKKKYTKEKSWKAWKEKVCSESLFLILLVVKIPFSNIDNGSGSIKKGKE